MRIRKNAKHSSLMISSSDPNTKPLYQTHICQLNQSPWDVITFPPSDPATPPYQFDRDNNFTENGSFGYSIGAVDSADSMKISMEGSEEMKEFNAKKWVYDESFVNDGENWKEGENPVGFKKKETVWCCKTDGKSWHCRREAKEGSSLCQHHLTQLQNYNNLANPTAKKLEKLVENRRRPRAKKASSSSNPNEFYYYSGFGPLWGKKRGTGRNEKAESFETIQSVDEPIAMPSSSSQINNEEFDFVDEEEDQDEENGVGHEKKRARKPIKARSLKSLM